MTEGAEFEKSEFFKINEARMNRIDKTYHASDDIQNMLKKVTHPLHWLVLTEHWCGDSAQILPILYKIASMSEGRITLHLLERDSNPELMDAHLTEGSRSIQKLIQLDNHMNISGVWGPRPKEAQLLVKKLKSDPETAKTYSEALHAWYTADKGRSIESDVLLLLEKGTKFCPECLAG